MVFVGCITCIRSQFAQKHPANYTLSPSRLPQCA